MRLLRWLAALVAALGLLVAAVFIGARFADGPLAMIPGGALRAGELVAEREVDWSFAADEQLIELQLLEPERSRTVWVVVLEGAAYVPVSLDFPPFKSWHHEAMEDGRAIVRVQGRRYERSVVRVTDESEMQGVRTLLIAKYALSAADTPFDPDRIWIFRLDPPS